MVVAVFSNLEEFRPQLSNQIVVSCPALSSIGGPLVSLETCGRVDAVVIVWAANRSCQYTVLINGQPMGGQVSFANISRGCLMCVDLLIILRL